MIPLTQRAHSCPAIRRLLCSWAGPELWQKEANTPTNNELAGQQGIIQS